MFFIEKRILKEALYIINNNATIRQTAQAFKISKSTVHKDVSEKLLTIDKELYCQTKIVLTNHLKTRHLKGGEVTRQKYKLLRT